LDNSEAVTQSTGTWQAGIAGLGDRSWSVGIGRGGLWGHLRQASPTHQPLL